jgi:hypothetical protein
MFGKEGVRLMLDPTSSFAGFIVQGVSRGGARARLRLNGVDGLGGFGGFGVLRLRDCKVRNRSAQDDRVWVEFG